MNLESIPGIALRWLHIFGAIAAAGGALFALMVLRPALAKLPEETRTTVHQAIRPKFAMLVMIAITALIVSGFYNYLVVLRPQHQGQPLYHALMGVKIMLAFVVFLIASALTGKSAAFAKLRENAGMWLGINVLLALTIVLLGAILRSIPLTPQS